MAHGSEWLCAFLAEYEAETERLRDFRGPTGFHYYTPGSHVLRYRRRTAQEIREYIVTRGQAELDAAEACRTRAPKPV